MERGNEPAAADSLALMYGGSLCLGVGEAGRRGATSRLQTGAACQRLTANRERGTLPFGVR